MLRIWQVYCLEAGRGYEDGYGGRSARIRRLGGGDRPHRPPPIDPPLNLTASLLLQYWFSDKMASGSDNKHASQISKVHFQA